MKKENVLFEIRTPKGAPILTAGKYGARIIVWIGERTQLTFGVGFPSIYRKVAVARPL